MRTALVTSIVLWRALALGAVLNVEFKFAPYTGDLEQDHVDTVPGRAEVFLNDVPIAVDEVRAGSVPVLFEEREIAPAVWVPVASLGQAVRKGKNVLRIAFEPTDAKVAYRAQLRWASVTDQAREEREPGSYKGTNQEAEGVENKEATGKVVFEREFSADFAQDQPWHHYPPVARLTDEDRQKLGALVVERGGWFAPDFAALYKGLEGNPNIDVAQVRKTRCLDAAYKAGARVKAPRADELEFVTTGHPEVVIRRKGGSLFVPDPGHLASIKSEETQMCAGAALQLAFPPRLVVVRTPAGAWQVVY